MISSKVNINITPDFTAQMNAIARVIEGNQPGGSGSGYSDLLLNIWRTPNNAYPVKNPNDSWGGTISYTNNLAAQAWESGYLNDNTRDIMANIKLKYDFNKLVKGLSARFMGSVTNQTRTAIVRTKQNPVFKYLIDEMVRKRIRNMGLRYRRATRFAMLPLIRTFTDSWPSTMNATLVSIILRVA